MLYPGKCSHHPYLTDASRSRSCRTKLYMPISESVIPIMVTGIELTDEIERRIMLRHCRLIMVGTRAEVRVRLEEPWRVDVAIGGCDE